MWFAIADIVPPIVQAAPIASPVSQTAGNTLTASQAAASQASPQAIAAPAPVENRAVFQMPAGLPPYLKKMVTVPKADEFSEFAALKSVAHQVGVPFSHTGPNYALLDTRVPFGKPVPSYEFLWYVGQSYIPGTVNVNGSGAIAVANQPVKK
jgi:hypothetical protein